jgi:hypothetical protein
MDSELTVAELDLVAGGGKASSIMVGILAGNGLVEGAMQGINPRGIAETIGKAAADVANHPPA